MLYTTIFGRAFPVKEVIAYEGVSSVLVLTAVGKTWTSTHLLFILPSN